MTTTQLWTAYEAAAANLLTTELNSLGNSSTTTLSTIGAAIDNTSNLFQFADVEFLAGGTYTPTAGGFLELWLVMTLDGTNYEDGSSSIPPGRPADIIIPIRNGTTITPRNTARGLLLPPALFKPLVRNQSGAALPSSGNTLRYRAYNNSYV
jgi:hypothetical protein